MFSDLLFRLRALFRKRTVEIELDDELRAHLEHNVEKYVKSGMTREDALRRARIDLGGLDQVKEECRDARGVNFIEITIQDVRYGLRQLRRSPGFTIVAILTLALGIGANTAIFSVVDAVLFKPLPYPDPDRLVMLWERNPANGIEQEMVTGPDFIDWRQQNQVFENVAFWPGWGGSTEFNIAGNDGIEKVNGIYASSALFQVLGVKPLMGRAFLPEEDQWQGAKVAIISHNLWQTRFGADSAILGRALTVDSFGRREYTIVGVMPRGFRFPNQSDIWLPAGWMGVHLEERRSAHWHSVIARLKSGVSVNSARLEMNNIQARIARNYPTDLIGNAIAVVPLLDQTIGRTLRPALFILWAAVACVLLIACSNLANLLLARGAARQKEIAIRLAVGASRRRISRQLLTESALLALTGGVFGVMIASWGLRLFAMLAAGHIPRLTEVELDRASFGYSLGISLFTGLLFGLAPAWQSTRLDLNYALKEGGRRGSDGTGNSNLRPFLVVIEIALSLVLLISAGLMTRSFVSRMQIDRGFQPDHLLTGELDFSVSGFTGWVHPTGTSPQANLGQIMERIRNYAGIESVAVASKLPRDTNSGKTFPVVIENHPSTDSAEYPAADFQGVSSDYFRTMGIPLLQGRSFTKNDVYEAPWVAVINQTMAQHYFPNQNPIGKRLALAGRKNLAEPDYNDPDGRLPWKEIIGVVGDTKTLGPTAETLPEVYVPYRQWPMQSPALVVRTSANVAIAAAAIRGEVKAVNSNLPPPVVQTMDSILADTVAEPRYQTLLISLFGITALILAAVGIYGVISYSVAQRTHEIGIRMALGASHKDIFALVARQGFKLTLIGVTLGIIGALGMTRYLSSLLYGVKPTDPLTFILVALILSAVALLASYVPARRATKVDPMVALRHE